MKDVAAGDSISMQVVDGEKGRNESEGNLVSLYMKREDVPTTTQIVAKPNESCRLRVRGQKETKNEADSVRS